MAIPDEWKEKFIAQIELWQNDETQERQRHVDRIKAELAALKSKIDRLNTAFTAGGLELGEFKELKNPLIVQTAVLEQQLTKALKKPFDSLAKTTVAAQLAASEAERNSVWWCLLNLARTFFDENPNF